MWAIGMVSTHVHLLLRIGPATDLSRLVQRFKGGSATLAMQQSIGSREVRLRWAKGYNVESISPRAVASVIEYIKAQSRRHPSEAIGGWRPVIRPQVASATNAEPRL